MKKRIQEIWQAGLEDFSARREQAEALRAAMSLEAANAPQLAERDLTIEEQVQRAVIAATMPLRQEVASLKREVEGLRAQLGKLKKAK
jgi:polyhydroxyalkanoate synthesis regulator phasin